ncbi:MAG: hypothetical protein AB7F86_00600 [Bdellovibrionales bacterium]
MCSSSLSSRAETYISLEGGPAWQTRNEQKIPTDGGDKFSISKLNQGPFLAYRLYAGVRWGEHHEIRGLYAPLSLDVEGQLPNSVRFQGQTFSANEQVKAFYKFNSYRLTYAYHFAKRGDWTWALGFTGKVRDAEVKLTQGSVSAKKTDVGFVPLLHLESEYRLSDLWKLRGDLDGLASTQGRAIDLGLFIQTRILENGEVFAGYRMVEGGADNKKVYSFAWLHYATIGGLWNF